jgi:hypothetical protein
MHFVSLDRILARVDEIGKVLEYAVSIDTWNGLFNDLPKVAYTERLEAIKTWLTYRYKFVASSLQGSSFQSSK